jgi:Family of unknown function (DUF6325)
MKRSQDKESVMPIGPLELLVIGFEGDHFKGEIARSIGAAEESGAIRVVDLIFVRKTADGEITALEIEETDESYARDFKALSVDIRALLTEDDAMTLATLLPPDTAALVALIEHTWAKDISEAVTRSGGRLLASQRISRLTIEAISDELEMLLVASANRQ